MGGQRSGGLKDQVHYSRRKATAFASPGREASGDPDYEKTAEEFLPPKALDGSPATAPGTLEPQSGTLASGMFYTSSTAAVGSHPMWHYAVITNTGNSTSDEIPQLYINHGGGK